MEQPEVILGQTQDRWGRAVVLDAARWEHVIRRHPEMVDERALILAAISFPDVVTHDADYPNRENFYRAIDWTPFGRPRRYIKVCVEYGAEGGTIITAFRIPTIKRAETQRWP